MIEEIFEVFLNKKGQAQPLCERAVLGSGDLGPCLNRPRPMLMAQPLTDCAKC